MLSGPAGKIRAQAAGAFRKRKPSYQPYAGAEAMVAESAPERMNTKKSLEILPEAARVGDPHLLAKASFASNHCAL